ncbi:hypothetical protein Tco_1148614 [Tanacetum coccineum]
MFTRSLILKRHVTDLQLGVESYQKKLNITKPHKTFPEIEFKEPYTPSYDPPGIIYEDLDKQKRVLQANELYKLSNGTLKSVHDEIHHRVLDFRLDYNPKIPKRKWTAVDQKRSGLMIELIDKHLREREIIRNLERLAGARELKMDYKLMTHAPVTRTASTAAKLCQGDSLELSLITSRMVIAEPRVGATTRSAAYMGSSSIGLWFVSLFEWNTPVSSMKSSIQVFKIIEDNVLFKLDFSDDSQNNPKPKTVVSTSGSNIDVDHINLIEKFKSLATKIDYKFLIIWKELKDMRDGQDIAIEIPEIRTLIQTITQTVTILNPDHQIEYHVHHNISKYPNLIGEDDERMDG